MRTACIQPFQDFSVIRGLTADNEGNIFVILKSGIWKIDSVSNSPHQLTHPDDRDAACLDGIIWLDTNTLFACHADLNWILHYNITGNQLTKLRMISCWSPRFITIDTAKNLYVSDLHRIFKVDMKKSYRTQTVAGLQTTYDNRRRPIEHYGFQDGESQVARFNNPRAIAVAKDGTVYVADWNNHCIREIKDGFVCTLAGQPGIEGYQNGPLSQALFSFPNCLVLLDNNKTLLVLDARQVIRRIDLEKNIVFDDYSYQMTTCIPLRILTRDRNENIYAVDSLDRIIKWTNTWRWERLLWLAVMKGDSRYCHLSQLPRDMIKILVRLLKS